MPYTTFPCVISAVSSGKHLSLHSLYNLTVVNTFSISDYFLQNIMQQKNPVALLPCPYRMMGEIQHTEPH
jgi:hypothetical protein